MTPATAGRPNDSGPWPMPPNPNPNPQPRPAPFPLPAWPTPPAPDQPRPAQPSAPDLELADRLLARRLVLISGPLDQNAASSAAARLMILDADSADPVELHLSCPDGELQASLMLAETVDLMRAPVTAVVLSVLGGCAVAVLAAADRRLAHPGCRVLLREPRSSAAGRAEDLASAAEQQAHMIGELCTWLARASGRQSRDVGDDLRQGRVLSAQQAVEYGLVHELLVPRH